MIETPDTKRSMPLWLKAVIGLTVVALLLFSGYVGYQFYTINTRRLATIESLRGNVIHWRQADDGCGKFVSFQTAATIEQLESSFCPNLDPPRIFAAYIDSSRDDEAPVLTLYWLEEGTDVDGVDLYVDGQLHATVTGWAPENYVERQDLLRFHENRYDRYIFVDIPVLPSHKHDNNRDVIHLTPAQIQGDLEVQLRTDKPCGRRLIVGVADSLLEEVN